MRSDSEETCGAINGFDHSRRQSWIIKATVDSGAAVTVMPLWMCPEYSIKESPSSKAGVNYKAASGQKIPDLGSRKLGLVTVDGKECKMQTSVAQVHKMLMSVAKMVDAGNEVHFGKSSWVRHVATNTYTPIRRENYTYVMEFNVLEPHGKDRNSNVISNIEKEANDKLSGNSRQGSPP